MTDEAPHQQGQQTPVLEKHIYPHAQGGIGIEGGDAAFMFLNPDGKAFIFPVSTDAQLSLGVGALLSLPDTAIANLPDEIKDQLRRKVTGGVILPNGPVPRG